MIDYFPSCSDFMRAPLLEICLPSIGAAPLSGNIRALWPLVSIVPEHDEVVWTKSVPIMVKNPAAHSVTHCLFSLRDEEEHIASEDGRMLKSRAIDSWPDCTWHC